MDVRVIIRLYIKAAGFILSRIALVIAGAVWFAALFLGTAFYIWKMWNAWIGNEPISLICTLFTILILIIFVIGTKDRFEEERYQWIKWRK